MRARNVFFAAGLAMAMAAPTALLASAAQAAAVPSVGKVAVVDLQRVLNETKAGKTARSKLEGSSKAKQDKLDKQRRKLEQDQSKLASMNGPALQAAQEKLQRDYMELQSMYMTLQQELAEQEARLLEDMYTKCQGLAKSLAKEVGADLILIRDQSTVLYAADSFDVTTEIIKRYDKKYK